MNAQHVVTAAAALVSLVASAASWPAAPLPAPGRAPQAGRPLAIEDYYRVETVGAPQFSADGRTIQFTVSTRLEADNGTRTTTYAVPVDGSAPPAIVPTAGGTGRLAGRGGRLGRAGGGEPGTAGASAPTGPASPDGKWTIVLRDVPRPPAPAPARTDFEKRHEDRFKGAAFDWMEFQRDGQPFPAPNLSARPAQQIVLQAAGAAPGAAPRLLVDLDIRPTGLVWHPDSTRVAFIADTTWRDEVKYERPDLWTVSIDGTLDRLTDDGYVYADLEYSPDGRFLSYARTFGTDMVIAGKLNHGGPRDLFARSATGEPVNLTARWDLEPGDSRWSPDSRHLYFTATIGGESHLFRVAVSGATQGVVEQITRGPRRIGGLAFSPDFSQIAYTVGLHDAPADIYVARIDGSGERRLTDVHRALTTEVAFGKTERLRWKSRDGTEIEGWLTLPHAFDRTRGPYPLIVFSHGGPHAATGYAFDFKKQFFAASGYFVFDTNFRSSTGYGEAFKWATWGAWGDKDGEDVMSGIDHVVSSYPVDARRVGHTGHSYGGFLTNWLITQYPDRFAAAVSGAGISNWISDYGTADIYRTKETEFFGTPWDEAARNRMIRQSPLTYAGRVKTPTLFVHGEVDQRVPYEEAEQMYFALKRRGVPARMIQYAGQPHGIGGHWNNVHRMLNELRWWETYLKPVPPAAPARRAPRTP
jgi:dipeptidyl aminopeptidase/acylaminoacyl peptidase